MKAPFRNTESRSVRQYLRPLLVGLLWAGVGVYVLWTGIAVHRERSARQVRGVEVEVVDTEAEKRFEAGQNQEDEEILEEPQATETVETEAQWEAGTEEDEEPASSDPSADFEEESGAAELSFEETVVDTASTRSANKRLPCVVVAIDGREAALILKHVVDGFVTVKFLDEDDSEAVEVEVERVRLLRVDDGQDE